MIFEVGKRYRWIGPEKVSEIGLPDELAKIWEKGKPHMLLEKPGENQFIFKGICKGIYKKDVSWAYCGYEDNFAEV